MLRVITRVGSCVRGSLHGWGHVWGHPSDTGATHSGKGSILGNASLFTSILFTIFAPLNPPPPNQQSAGFPLEFLLEGPQTELRTLSQNCEQTLQKLRTNRIVNKRAFLIIAKINSLGISERNFPLRSEQDNIVLLRENLGSDISGLGQPFWEGFLMFKTLCGTRFLWLARAGQY